MKKIYKNAVLEAFRIAANSENDILTEEDIKDLPAAVRKYIKLTGSTVRPRVWNFRAEFTGGIRSGSSDEFMPLKSVQYNFIDKPARFFYIVARKKGIPARGVHLYRDCRATMQIRIFGLFTVVDARGKEMDQGETVTLFNDMCFMAPATLISKSIQWKEIDNQTVEAQYTNGNITIGATLYFNEAGELVNFISGDRYETTDGKTYKNYPWLTPVTGYTSINGYYLPSGAKLVYRHPDEDFCYGEFSLKNIEYNCQSFH